VLGFVCVVVIADNGAALRLENGVGLALLLGLSAVDEVMLVWRIMPVVVGFCDLLAMGRDEIFLTDPTLVLRAATDGDGIAEFWGGGYNGGCGGTPTLGGGR